MKILPSSPLGAYIQAVELDGEPIQPTFIDLDNGRVQHWLNGAQVEAKGVVRILLQSKDDDVSLDPVLDTELSRLLEGAKKRLARMSPADRDKMYKAQKQSFATFNLEADRLEREGK